MKKELKIVWDDKREIRLERFPISHTLIFHLFGKKKIHEVTHEEWLDLLKINYEMPSDSYVCWVSPSDKAAVYYVIVHSKKFKPLNEFREIPITERTMKNG